MIIGGYFAGALNFNSMIVTEVARERERERERGKYPRGFLRSYRINAASFPPSMHALVVTLGNVAKHLFRSSQTTVFASTTGVKRYTTCSVRRGRDNGPIEGGDQSAMHFLSYPSMLVYVLYMAPTVHYATFLSCSHEVEFDPIQPGCTTA